MDLGKFRILKGKKTYTGGRHPCCYVCLKEILDGQDVVFIHPVGEVGRELHKECGVLFATGILKQCGKKNED